MSKLFTPEENDLKPSSSVVVRSVLVMQTSRDKLLSVGLAKVISCPWVLLPLSHLRDSWALRCLGSTYLPSGAVFVGPTGAAFGQLVMREVATASDTANLSLLRAL